MQYPFPIKNEELSQFLVKSMRELGEVPYSVRNNKILTMFSPFTGNELTLSFPYRLEDSVAPSYTLPIKDGELFCKLIDGFLIAEVGDTKIPIKLRKVEYSFDYLYTHGTKILGYIPYAGRDFVNTTLHFPVKIVLRCPEDGCFSEITVEVAPKNPEGIFVCEGCSSKFKLINGTILKC